MYSFIRFEVRIEAIVLREEFFPSCAVMSREIDVVRVATKGNNIGVANTNTNIVTCALTGDQISELSTVGRKKRTVPPEILSNGDRT